MNWDHLMKAKAESEGWGLTTVIDNGKTHPYLMVTRTGSSPFKSDLDAGTHVVNQARQGGPLHRHALSLVSASRFPPAAKPKGKK